MYAKDFLVKNEHLDFQGVVDGLYYPFYMEEVRHSFMKEVVGLDLKKEFKEGRIHMLLEYTLKFKRSLRKDDILTVTCKVSKSDKKNRVKFSQQILVNDTVYAEGEFLATCLVNGRPTIPQEVIKNIDTDELYG